MLLLKFIVVIALVVGGLIVLSRLVSREELDDVHPLIMGVNDPHIDRSEWLWVIPLYAGEPISNHPHWCKHLLSTGKKIGLHGVRHTHREFGVEINDHFLDTGIDEFVKAFGFYPTHFKAPSLDLHPANRKKLEDRGIKIFGKFNQVIHNVHHSPKNRLADGKLAGET